MAAWGNLSSLATMNPVATQSTQSTPTQWSLDPGTGAYRQTAIPQTVTPLSEHATSVTPQKNAAYYQAVSPTLTAKGLTSQWDPNALGITDANSFMKNYQGLSGNLYENGVNTGGTEHATGQNQSIFKQGATDQQLADYLGAQQYGLEHGYLQKDAGIGGAVKDLAVNFGVPVLAGTGIGMGISALAGAGGGLTAGGSGFSEAMGGGSGLGGASGTVGGGTAAGAAGGVATAAPTVGSTAASAGMGAGNLGAASSGFGGFGNLINGLTTVPGLTGAAGLAYNIYNSGQLKDIAKQSSQAANPLNDPQRQNAQNLLNAYLNGSQDITQNPTVKAALDYSQRQAQAKMAQLHLSNSGNAIQASTDYANEAYNKTAIPMLQTLAGIGGYNLGPGNAGTLLGNYENAANNSIGYGLQNLFQGMQMGAPQSNTNTGGTLGGASQLASTDGPFGTITSRS